MRAYVLCGGLGSRLRAVTNNGQKAVVDVHGEPFLLLVLRQLKIAGIDDVVLCAGYRADQLADLLEGLSSSAEMPLHLVVEDKPLGTGGALLHALEQQPPEAPYLVLNADTYLTHEAFSLPSDSANNLILAAEVTDRARYGSLRLADDGQVLELLEKGESGAGWVNAGVYCFTTDAMAQQPVRACSMEVDLLPVLIAQKKLLAVLYRGPFIDIGTPDSLASFKDSTQRSTQR